MEQSNKIALSMVSILFAVFLSFVSAGRALSELPPAARPQIVQPSSSDVAKAIDLSVAYLERSCDEDGRFVYLVDPRTGKRSGKYNVVRHAGAIYSLALYNQLHPDRNALAAMVRAGSFLRRNYLRDDPTGVMRIVWPEPVGTKPLDHACSIFV